MTNALLQIISASGLCAFISTVVAVLVTFNIRQKWLGRMVSFSAGMLLTVSLLDLLPEALERGADAKTMFTILLAGILAFFFVEKTILSSHMHSPAGTSNTLSRSVPIVLIGGSLHICTDGLLLAAAFMVNPALGWSMTMATVAHEVPREVGDFALLLAAGWSRRKTVIWNLISRLACTLGGVMGYFVFAKAHFLISPVLTVAAASFIYIAVAGLFPWLKNETGAHGWHNGFMAAGVFLGCALPG